MIWSNTVIITMNLYIKVDLTLNKQNDKESKDTNSSPTINTWAM